MVVAEQAQFELSLNLIPISFAGNLTAHLTLPTAALSVRQWQVAPGPGIASVQVVVQQGTDSLDLVLQNLQVNSTDSSQTVLKFQFTLQLLNDVVAVALPSASRFAVTTTATVDYQESAGAPLIPLSFSSGITPTSSWTVELAEPAHFTLSVAHTAPANVEGGDIFQVTYTLQSSSPSTDSLAFQGSVDIWLPAQLSYINNSAAIQNNPKARPRSSCCRPPILPSPSISTAA